MGKKDITGQRFGKLTVLYEAEPRYLSNGKRKIMWHCVCDCGNEIDAFGIELRAGKKDHCGCLHWARLSQVTRKNKNKNRYDLSGSYGIGYTNKGEEFYFDKEDYELISKYCWWLR